MKRAGLLEGGFILCNKMKKTRGENCHEKELEIYDVAFVEGAYTVASLFQAGAKIEEARK